MITSVIAREDSLLPDTIVWMPAGVHEISANTLDSFGYRGEVVCDLLAAANVIASFRQITESGQRVWIDLNHDDGAAAAWVKSFSWDPGRGIIASVEWTPRGRSALVGREFFSFSPAFTQPPSGGRPAGLIANHAAGGLVNAPAFGSAMPALVAASHAEIHDMQGRDDYLAFKASRKPVFTNK